MSEQSNLEIIKQVYRDFGDAKIHEVIKYFDPEVVVFRPGAPVIPFSGTFKGIEGLSEMFQLTSQHILLTSFLPEKFCNNEDMVVVMGTDAAEVLTTGKTYTSEWVQAFSFRNKKIFRIQVYWDTAPIIKAFTK